jgi:hypothetical protein
MSGSGLLPDSSDVSRGGDVPSPTESPAEAKNPHAVALGRLGGLKGGRAAAERMTPEERRERAQKAARARWGKKRRKKPK